MIKPVNFDGAKFAAKYNLDPFKDFWDDGKGNIIYPSLPNLTNADLLDCIVDPPNPYTEFDKPIKVPDFIVSTPPINPDPEKALDEAIAEMEKGEGEPKSLDLIVRSTFKALEHAMKEIDKLRLDVEQLKKKVK